MSDILSIGMSSLIAYKSALSLTSNNIANSNTPYFSRRQYNFASAQFGGGVTTGDAQRIYNESANRFAQQANCDFSSSNIYLLSLQNLSPMLNDNTTSVGKYLNDTFKALQDLNLNTNSSLNRSTYLNKLGTLVQAFQTTSNEIDRQRNVVNQSLQTSTQSANTLLNNIAAINLQLSTTPADAQADLLDTREATAQQLGLLLNCSVQYDSSNNMNITLSNGVSLVSGTGAAAQLTTIVDPANSSNILIAVKSGSTTQDVTSFITSGSMGGQLEFRANGLNIAQHALGRLAIDVSQALNAQNKLGINGNGVFGGNIFNDVNSTDWMSTRVIANANNTGTSSMGVSISDLTKLTSHDYQLSFGTGNSYTLIDTSTHSVVTTGTLSSSFPQTLAFNGVTLNIASGTFNAGDKYILSPTNNANANLGLAISDGALLALAWPVTASNGVKQEGSSGAIAVTGITDPSNSSFSTPGALSPKLQIQFLSSTSYQIVNATDSTVIAGPLTYNPATGAPAVFPTGAPSNYDPGYRVSLSGVIQTGDTFDINYNSNCEGDNNNGKAISALYNKGILDNGAASFGQGYNAIASNAALTTQAAQLSYNSSQAIQKAAVTAADNISGVSLEEETMNLARYQQAYQASAQILQVARTVFDSIISLTRR